MVQFKHSVAITRVSILEIQVGNLLAIALPLPCRGVDEALGKRKLPAMVHTSRAYTSRIGTGMKYIIVVVSAATVFIASASIFAQTTRPATAPVIEQATVDAAMERLRNKQAGGRSLEDRVVDLERIESNQNKHIAELERRLTLAAQQIEQMQRQIAPAVAAPGAQGDGNAKRGDGQNPKASANKAALDRARGNLIGHLKSLQEARDRVAQTERQIADGGKPNTSIDYDKYCVAQLEKWVAQDQAEIARLEAAQ
jgi:hypothetical protein